MEFCVKLLSLPSWERGLKSLYGSEADELSKSLPSWERGLKFRRGFFMQKVRNTSLPSWERGLKSA